MFVRDVSLQRLFEPEASGEVQTVWMSVWFSLHHEYSVTKTFSVSILQSSFH